MYRCSHFIKIYTIFTIEPAYPRRIQGGSGTPKFNFEFTYKEKTFSGYGVQNVQKFVMELGYKLDMWHFDANYGHTLRLFIEVIVESDLPSKSDWVKLHDSAMSIWIDGGEVLHVWRNWDGVFLVSYYITLFRYEGRLMIDFGRIYENARNPYIDQRTNIAIRDGLVYESIHSHPYRGIGSEW